MAILSFDSFNEGRAEKFSKGKYNTKKGGNNRIKDEAFREKVQNVVQSFGGTTKQVGSDLEVHMDDERVAQVIFRPTHIGIARADAKYFDEFSFNEFGKVKSKLSEILNH